MQPRTITMPFGMAGTVTSSATELAPSRWGLVPHPGKEKFMRRSMATIAILSMTMLAACGHREPERAEGGAAAGAATGATVGLVGGPVGVAAGAAIGGVAGGATGAATKPKDVNLGAPPWRDNTETGQKAAKHLAN
jgi:phage tail tape-measure protein